MPRSDIRVCTPYKCTIHTKTKEELRKELSCYPSRINCFLLYKTSLLPLALDLHPLSIQMPFIQFFFSGNFNESELVDWKFQGLFQCLFQALSIHMFLPLCYNHKLTGCSDSGLQHILDESHQYC